MALENKDYNILRDFVGKVKNLKAKDKYTFTKTIDFSISAVFNGSYFADAYTNYYGLSSDLYNNRFDPFLIEELDYYIVKTDLPNLTHGNKFINIGGLYEKDNMGINSVILSNSMVIPQEYELKMSFRDTKTSLFEGLFLPWMQYNASPRGEIPHQEDFLIEEDVSSINDYYYEDPIKKMIKEQQQKDTETAIKSFRQTLTANISIDMHCFKNNSTVQVYRTYTFVNAFPVAITNPNFDENKSELITRDVHFAFSYIDVKNR